ncbi:hypothetical protein BC938DRAFT_480083 [Jimgerdemannia flammicorona]|uniref:Secreted protein n=1 Tax=Jimgerdemannia flammicorona TaxID=994334 RepID=A0A433QJF3_9FUNG|nr:hypothetical protein BC938DRAFT_480083 [Jimgerdemannia flammicorona]
MGAGSLLLLFAILTSSSSPFFFCSGPATRVARVSRAGRSSWQAQSCTLPRATPCSWSDPPTIQSSHPAPVRAMTLSPSGVCTMERSSKAYPSTPTNVYSSPTHTPGYIGLSTLKRNDQS